MVYPAALGAKVACPDKQVIDIDGDGLVPDGTCRNWRRLTLKNRRQGAHPEQPAPWHGSAVGRQILRRQRGHTYLGDPENREQIYPDFIAMAKSFNVPAERVMFKKDLPAALQRMLDSDEPYLLDVITPYTEHVLPFIPAGRTVAEMIYQQ